MLDLLSDLQQEKNFILKQRKYGIISYIDSVNELEMISRKELKIKRSLVDKAHVGKNGEPRKISYMKNKELWYTKMPDGTKLYAKDIDSLYEKLFSWYHLMADEYTVKSVFLLAIREKERTENNNPNTIKHYRDDFMRFITEEFASRDIRKITKADMKEYTQTMVNRLHPIEKGFLNYKTLLNVIFKYACEYDIINSNPVCAIKNSIYLKSCDCSKRLSVDNILSENEIDRIREEIRKCSSYKRYNGYFINGYGILIAIETGMRVGELCALKWSDVYDTYIHIHAQQLTRDAEHGNEYYYANWTKDEKGISSGGRYFPLTPNLKSVLTELKDLQIKLGIPAEYVLCHEDGSWIKTDAYETCLRRLMKRLGMNVTNNHSLRKSLNSNVLIPMGFNEVERASILGHSVETNLKYYTFSQKNSIDTIYERFNRNETLVTPRSPQKVVSFEKEKSRLVQ